MSFAHLHVHTTYSLLDGYGHPKAFAERCLDNGMTALGCTDHGTITGHVAHAKACGEIPIWPVYGCEFYLVENMTDRGVSEEDEANISLRAANVREAAQMRKELQKGAVERWHVVALALNDEGYANLRRLVTRSYHEGFYRKPRVDLDALIEHRKGLVILTACIKGLIPSLILTDYEQARDAAAEWRDAFGDKLFFEIMPLELKEQQQINAGLMKLGRELGIRCVATNDAHYPVAEDAWAHDVLLAVGTGKKVSDANRLKFRGGPYCLLSLEQMQARFRRLHDHLDQAEVEAALHRAGDLAFACKADPLARKASLPTFKLPEGFGDPDEYLRHLCRDGFVRRGLDSLPEDWMRFYGQRAEHELKTIQDKGFATYFLITWDAVEWARRSGITIGPARGSSAGSLVSYLLGITGIDPIRFNLSFERFIAPHRMDWPDVDIDVEDVKREQLKAYLEEQYGAECIANVATVNAMRARQAFRDAARAFGAAPGEVERVLGALGSSLGDEEAEEDDGVEVDEFEALERDSHTAEVLREFRTLHPDVFRGAKALRGQLRTGGVHAAGIVLANEPLQEFTAVEMRSGAPVVSLTKYECETLGLVKFDFLGLKTMTVISEALLEINKARGDDPLTVEKIVARLDVPEVFSEFAAAHTAGVFQFNKRGGRALCASIKPRTIEELAAINALDRPGPLDSGATELYVERRNGRAPVPKIHPAYDSITAETFGLVIYQEQVMEICRQLAGMDWENVHRVRKIISLKLSPDEFKPHEKIFVEGSVANGCPRDTAEEIWRGFLRYAGYAFNRSHAVAYAVIGYVCMALKVYYPAEYLCAVAEFGADAGVREAIAEARRLGIRVAAPDVNASGLRWTLSKGVVYASLCSVKGVGEVAAVEIIKAREEGGPFSDIIDFLKRTPKRQVNKGIIDKLVSVGAFRSLHTNTKALGAFLPEALGIRDGKRTTLFGEALPPALDTAEEFTLREFVEQQAELLAFAPETRLEDCFDDVFPELDELYPKRKGIAELRGAGAAGKFDEYYLVAGTVLRVESNRADPGSRKRSIAIMTEDSSGEIILRLNPYRFKSLAEDFIQDGAGQPIIAVVTPISEKTADIQEVAFLRHFAEALSKRAATTECEGNLLEHPGREAMALRPPDVKNIKAQRKRKRPHVVGIANRVWSARTRKGSGPEMGFVELRDESGLYLVLLWANTWERYQHWLQDGAIYEARLGRTKDGVLCCDVGRDQTFRRLDVPEEPPLPDTPAMREPGQPTAPRSRPAPVEPDPSLESGEEFYDDDVPF